MGLTMDVSFNRKSVSPVDVPVMMNKIFKAVEKSVYKGVSVACTKLIDEGKKVAKEEIENRNAIGVSPPGESLLSSFNSVIAIGGRTKQDYYLVSLAKHAIDLEYGIEPTFVSFNDSPKLKEWVDRKAGLPQKVKSAAYSQGGLYVGSNPNSPLSKENPVGFMKKAHDHISSKLFMEVSSGIIIELSKLVKQR